MKEGNFHKAVLEINILEWMPYGVSDLCHYDSGLLINYIVEQVAQKRVSVHNRHIYLNPHCCHANPGPVVLADCE